MAIKPPPAPAQVLLLHEQSLRAVAPMLRDHTRALLAGLPQVWTMKALAERWALDVDQARALVHEHVSPAAAAAGRCPLEGVLKVDQIVKEALHASPA